MPFGGAAAEVVQRHGGIVNQAIGDEIVSLFGVPIAHEDDDLRAVRAAIELRQRTREVGASVEPALGSTGPGAVWRPRRPPGRPAIDRRAASGMP